VNVIREDTLFNLRYHQSCFLLIYGISLHGAIRIEETSYHQCTSLHLDVWSAIWFRSWLNQLH